MLVAALALVSSHQNVPYLDPAVPVPTRVDDLVRRLTLAEKVAQMQHEAPAIPRLNIPAYTWWSEALHGAVGDPVTVFPQAIGLSATFDTPLMHQIGTAISDEGRARYASILAKRGSTGMHEGLTFWAPNINIFRDPRWGRGQETYGEDPFLTSRMAVEYVRAMQDERGGKLKAISTPKHYAVHSGPDPERHAFNAVVDGRDEWNTYLPAFRAAVQEGGAWSVMSAYSAVNGVPDSANRTLLQDILRDRFGFRGYVVSDCGAIYDIFQGHKYVKTAAEAAAAAVNAGCDLECGDAYKALQEAVAKHLISEATIDKSVRRLFEARIRLGMFDPAGGSYNHVPISTIDSAEHRALALKAARESLVLLKNQGILPLRSPGTVGVIGPNANDRSVPLGNYNGTPSRLSTVLEGIRAEAPAGTRVLFNQGSNRLSYNDMQTVPESALPGGVDGTYYAGETLSGDPILRQHSTALDFDWGNGSPAAGVPQTHYSARYTATLVAPTTGTYRIGVRSDDGARVKVDGQLIAEDWTVHAARLVGGPVKLVAGQGYHVEVEYFQGEGQASVALQWSKPTGARRFAEALDIAHKSDVVVMVLGISGELENEELDRDSIELPVIQQQLLKAVLGTGKPVVVVLESGSCLAVEDPRILGLMQAWYPGEEGGRAVAEALFGKTNPAGRLPITFYKSLAQVPAFRSYKMDGRTYRYLHEKPLYGFGYGLSYTTFRYSDAQLAFRKQNNRYVHFEMRTRVENTGKVAGDEVVQVYSSRDGAAWPEPIRRLVGFQRVTLKPGEIREVTVPIRLDALETADKDGHPSRIPGRYKFSVGGGQPGLYPRTSGRVSIASIDL